MYLGENHSNYHHLILKLWSLKQFNFYYLCPFYFLIINEIGWPQRVDQLIVLIKYFVLCFYDAPSPWSWLTTIIRAKYFIRLDMIRDECHKLIAQNSSLMKRRKTKEKYVKSSKYCGSSPDFFGVLWRRGSMMIEKGNLSYYWFKVVKKNCEENMENKSWFRIRNKKFRTLTMASGICGLPWLSTQPSF